MRRAVRRGLQLPAAGIVARVPARDSILVLLAWLCAAAAAVLQAPGAAAASSGSGYEWRNVTVGAGGFAPNIIFSPAEPGLAYLRTDMGGAYRWDVRAGRWIPLQDGMAEGSYFGIESLAADPADPDIVYLAAGMYRRGPAAILRSADRGATWRITPVPFRMGGNEDGRGMGERLVIDPNRTSTLFFGSRHDGLFRSDDSGATWRNVDSFPVKGLGVSPPGRPTNAGLSFVLVDPRSGSAGEGSSTIYAGSADPGPQHLFRSADGGASWQPVPGGPGPGMLPTKAAIDREGLLYVTYASSIGPSGIARGAVWRFDSRTGDWRDITPDPGGEGGYMGLGLNAQQPGTLVVSSVNRWQPGDTVWRSTDRGLSWDDLGARSRRDVSETPFLKGDEGEADFGHWTAGLAIDPFDSGHIAYTTGATLYATREGDRPGEQLWKPWVRGIEQTAIISLASPTGGAHLVSGFGDIRGFVHDDFSRSPPHFHLGIETHNTNQIDYAGAAPDVVVRSGTGREIGPEDATLAWSDDGGRSWTALRAPAIRLVDDGPAQRLDLAGEASIVVSADGGSFVVNTPVVLVTQDRGRGWSRAEGLPLRAQAFADKSAPGRFYAVDWEGRRLFRSDDGGRSFAPAAAAGLPDISASRPRNREQPFPIVADPARAGHLWMLTGGRLWHSTDGGSSFRSASRGIEIDRFGIGKSAPGAGAAALFATGERGGNRGVFRSTDGGKSWLRINDDAHQWGLRFRVITGDPRLFGRVYIGTDGRGVLYGDPL